MASAVGVTDLSRSGIETGTDGALKRGIVVLVGVGDGGEASLGRFFLGVEVIGVFGFV